MPRQKLERHIRRPLPYHEVHGNQTLEHDRPCRVSQSVL
jgi:hypothetical protein